MIRFTLIGGMLGLMLSCHPPKEMTNEQPKSGQTKETAETTKSPTDSYYLGEVQVLDCGVVIEVITGTTDEKKYTFSPTNLDSKFQVDKLRLKLKFKVLDQKATTCSEFQAIEISEVFAVR